jgi:hypothetical protein
MKMFREFLATLAVYVRTTDGALSDTRDSAAQKYAEIDPESLAEMVPAHDLAAIFSGVVKVSHQKSLAALKTAKVKQLQALLTAQAHDGKLPLEAVPGHPACQMLADLAAHEKGRVLYRDMALLLNEAAKDHSLRPYLFGCTAQPPRGEDDAAHDDEPSEVLAPPGEGDDLHQLPEQPPEGYPTTIEETQ